MVRKIIGGYFLFGAVVVLFALGKQGKAVEGVLCACVFALLGFFIWPKKKATEQQSAKGGNRITARMVFFWFFCLSAVIGGVITATDSGETFSSNLAATIAFALIAFMLRPESEKAKQRKVAKQAAKQAELEAKRAEQELRLARELASLSGEHAVGLPLAQGTTCVLHFGDEFVTASGGGNEFKLAYAKITDMSVHSDVEIQKSYVSSVGGAIGGAMLFGTLGAMVGGRAKEKQSKVIEYYFIITYLKDDGVGHLSFRVENNAKAQMIADRHRGKISKATNVTTL